MINKRVIKKLRVKQSNIFIFHCKYYNPYINKYSCNNGSYRTCCIPIPDCKENLSEEGKNKYNIITRKLKLLKLMDNEK